MGGALAVPHDVCLCVQELVSPVVMGFDNLPAPASPNFSRPMLFVGNHQRVGFYDTPLLVFELYVRGYK